MQGQLGGYAFIKETAEGRLVENLNMIDLKMLTHFNDICKLDWLDKHFDVASIVLQNHKTKINTITKLYRAFSIASICVTL